MMEEFLREEGALPAAGEVDLFEHIMIGRSRWTESG
jgi:hypothetical protein